MRTAIVAAWLAAGAAACHAAGFEFSGQVRPEWLQQTANGNGPLAGASALSPGLVALPGSGPVVESELHAQGHGFTGIATWTTQRLRGTGQPEATQGSAWVDELYWSGGSKDGWQFSVGKKIVSWDVGYGFRPNDFVEQEVRRTLLTVTPEGRPLVAAEHFSATTAWSLVLVNPTGPHGGRGANEPALALRAYRRDGAVDWYGYARLGSHTGASAGAAAAWVASESIELHGSVRMLNQADSISTGGASGLVRSDPWHDATIRGPVQWLVGGTWTNADQLSLLVEGWWDGTALSDAAWDAWNMRHRGLAALAGTAPAGAVAGNLAWQADAFGAAQNLRRANAYARLSWQHDKWEPAIDLLVEPADAGHAITASLGWQGDRIRVDAGARFYGGPGSAVLAQIPTRRIVYAALTYSF
ncbi:MAG: hypothetical protein JSR59_16340 [Proteobacteria bacterium]|nr:hypothetical protein [Pseudomonadota bacterium]